MKIRLLNNAVFLFLSVSAFSQVRQKANIEKLVSGLSDVYQQAQLLMDSMYISNNVPKKLWSDLLLDKNISRIKPMEGKDSPINITSGFPDLGLKWVSEVNSNFKQDISDSEDLISRLRLSTGIDWLIWGEGSFSGKRKERHYLKRTLDRDNLARNIRIQEIDIKDKYDLIQNVFDARRLILLSQYVQLLENERVHETNMHRQGLYDDVRLKKNKLEINTTKSSIDLIKRYAGEVLNDEQLHQYWNLPEGLTDLPDLPVLAEKLLSNSKVKLFKLNQEVLKTQKRGTSDFSLRVKLRYNYNEYKNNKGRTYPSLGLTVSVPLNFNRRNKLLEYELNEQLSIFEQEYTDLSRELKDRHRHFYLLKNELSVLENDIEYIKALLNSEKEKSQKGRQEFSPITYIDLSKKFILKKIEILDKQQELCVEFMQFYLKAGFLDDKAEHSELSSSIDTQTDYSLSTYLWGHFFTKKTNEQLLFILDRAHVNTVFFSPNNSDSTKVADFITKSNAAGIRVYRLISENSYALSDSGYIKLQKKLEEVAGMGFSGIHLNIEPHTFADYSLNLSTYTSRMNNLFKGTKQWCDDHRVAICVSIPMHTPTETALVLKEEGIDSYIMAYENDDHLKLLHRTSELRRVLGKNIGWVLRLNDFKSINDVNRTKDILQDYGILKLAYYDCSLLDKL